MHLPSAKSSQLNVFTKWFYQNKFPQFHNIFFKQEATKVTRKYPFVSVSEYLCIYTYLHAAALVLAADYFSFYE